MAPQPRTLTAPLTLLLTLYTLSVTQACRDPVRDARRDPTPAALHMTPVELAEVPPDFSSEPARQVCYEDSDCALVRGLPGQRLETLCCATCATSPVALNLDHAARVADWKAKLNCQHVACPPLGDCHGRRDPTGARCQANMCVATD